MPRLHGGKSLREFSRIDGIGFVCNNPHPTDEDERNLAIGGIDFDYLEADGRILMITQSA